MRPADQGDDPDSIGDTLPGRDPLLPTADTGALARSPSLARQVRGSRVDTAPVVSGVGGPIPSGLGTAGGFERFSDLRELGSGGMGSVLEAYDPLTRRRVAIKVMKVKRGPQSAGSRRFLREGRVTAQLEHPNIVPVYEVGYTSSDQVYFAMRRVEGRTMAEVLEQPASERPGLARLLRDFLKVCEAVSYAHARGVVHRDLKPANVMYGPFGEILVLDWGLAKILDALGEEGVEWADPDDPHPEDLLMTRPGAVIGTVLYMSPEQATGDTSRIDHRSDVYSLGSMLYEIVAGIRPFDGATPESLLLRIATGRFPPPSVRAPEAQVPTELEAVVLRSMATRPEDRYPTVDALREDLEAFLEGRMLATVAYSPRERLVRWIRRHRRLLASAVGVVAASLLLGWGLSRLGASRERARLEARLDRRESLLDEPVGVLASAEQALTQGRPEAALADLDGFDRRFGAVLEEIRGDDALAEGRPDAVALARELPGRVSGTVHRALEEWSARELEGLPPADGPADEPAAARAEAAWTRLTPLLAGGHESLPAADFALWLARRAWHAGDEASAHRWIAEILSAQPRSVAAASACLLLAERREDQGEYLSAAMSHHLALSVFGDLPPALRARALVGLTRTMASLGPDAKTPFAPEVRAREMALRAILEVVDESGQLRPWVGAVPAGLAREASDWLSILRQVVRFRDLPDLSWSSLDDAPGQEVGLATEGARVRRWEMVDPGLPAPTPDEIDVAAAVEAHRPGTGIRKVHGAHLARILPGRSEPQLLLTCSTEERGLLLIGLESFARPVSFLRVELPLHLMTMAAGDVDGDGLVDLAIAFCWTDKEEQRKYSATAHVFFQEPGGRFAKSVALSPSDGRLPSIVRRIEIVDLDGDGANEVVVASTSWNRFAVDAYHSSADRELRLVATRPVGSPTFRTVALPGGGRRVLLVSSSDVKERESLRILRAPEQAFGLRILDFDGTDWVTPESPVHAPPPLHDWEGYDDLTELMPLSGGEWVLGLTRAVDVGGVLEPWTDWAFFSGLPDASGPDRVRRMAGTFVRGDRGTLVEVPGSWRTGQFRPTRSYDPCSPGDLLALAGAPVPRGTLHGGGERLLLPARTLLEFHLPEEALRIARRSWTEAGRPASIRDALVRLEIAALSELHRYDELGDLLAGATPSIASLPELSLGAEALAADGRRFATAAELLGGWADRGDLPPSWRTRLAARASEWLELESALGKPTCRWSPGAGPGQGLLVSRPWALDPERDGERTFARVLCGPEPGTGNDGYAGTVVRMDGGSFRLVVDFRIPDAGWNEFVGLGLIPIGRSGPRVGLTLLSGGANDEDSLLVSLVPGSPTIELDAAIGRWLRLDVEYLASLHQVRFVLADLASGEVLLHRRARPLGSHPIRPECWLLGVSTGAGGSFPFPCEVHVAGMALSGSARPYEGGDPGVEAWLDGGPRELSAAVLDQFAGRVEDGAALLDARAARLVEAAGAGAEPPHGALEARIEAAWWRSGGAGADFANRVSELAATEAGRSALVDWVVSKPRSPRYRGSWAAVGRALAGALHPGQTAAEVLGGPLARAVAEKSKAIEPAIVGAWVLAELPGQTSAGRTFCELASLALPTLRPYSRRHALDRMVVEELQGWTPPRAAALLASRLFGRLRRDDGIRVLSEATPGDAKTLAVQRELVLRRLETLDRERRLAAADPVTFPRFQDE